MKSDRELVNSFFQYYIFPLVLTPLICGCRRVTVAGYWVICLALITNITCVINLHDLSAEDGYFSWSVDGGYLFFLKVCPLDWIARLLREVGRLNP